MQRALALAALAVAAPATALAGGGGSTSGGFFVVDTIGGQQSGHAVTSRLQVTGSLTVDFHGDQAAGCEAAHLCDVVGAVRWNPAGPGDVFAFAYRDHGKRFEQGFVSIGQDTGDGGPLRTSARVRRAGVPASLCADGASQDSVGAESPPRRGSSIELRLLERPSSGNPTAEVLRTRCAGPTAGDIAALLPTYRVGERTLLRGHKTLDFSADRAFAAHGLAGTLHSTVHVRVVGGERLSGNQSDPRPFRTRKRRRRAIVVTYRVQRVSGQITTGVRGAPDPDLCGPLDACGLLGAVTVAPAASAGSASLNATASIRRTRKDLRRALGLAAGARPRGVTGYGGAFWDPDRGNVTAQLTRDGAPACSDTEPIAGGGAVSLEFLGGRVRASYGGDSFGGTDLLRTRCPGPASGDVAGPLASGSFPVSVFRHRRVRLRLTGGRGLTGVGYSGRTHPDLTVVLRRTGVREYTFTEELPAGYPGDNVQPLH